MKSKYAILDEISLELVQDLDNDGEKLLFDSKEQAKCFAEKEVMGWQIIEIPFGEEQKVIEPLNDTQKRSLTEWVRQKVGQDYIHIPKNEWLKKLLQEVLYIGKVRGRGKDKKLMAKDGLPENSFTRDGAVPMKYATKLYLPLK